MLSPLFKFLRELGHQLLHPRVSRRLSTHLGRSALPVQAVAWVLGLTLAFVLGSPYLHHPAQAQTQAAMDLQQQQQLIEQQRSNVSRQRQQVQDLEGAARNRLGGLERNIQMTDAQLQTHERQIQQAAQKLSDLETKLVQAQSVYQARQDKAAVRLRFLQRQRDTDEWATLLQSKTLEQLMSRRRQLKRVYASEQQTLVALMTERDRINERKLQVETQKNQIALLSQQLLDQKAEYKAESQVQTDLVSRLTSDRLALEAAEAQLAEDSRKIALIIRERVPTGSISPGTRLFGTGRMTQPSNGPITSNFGWRIHPILGTGRFHAGTDFGAEHGSPILAADSGTVIFAGWYGGYGNAVIVDHGNGLTTLYGHASELYVVEGQAVRQGQMIATVGSTGLSTGPHLHFEVRRNGEPTDPIAFL